MIHGSLVDLPPFRDDGRVLVVVETPKGSRSKFVFDEELGCLTWSTPLPTGLTFPFDFGFVPRTRAEDGDPLDMLLLHREPMFAGCVVEARLLGVLRAVQQKGRAPQVRNDRLVAVPHDDPDGARLRSLRDLGGRRLDEMEAFFVAFGAARGKRVAFGGRGGPAQAMRLIREANRRFERDGDVPG